MIMAEMVIEVPGNWIAFLEDVAGHMKEEPAEYWGKYLTDHLSQAMHDDRYWLFAGLQDELIEKHGLSIGDKDD